MIATPALRLVRIRLRVRDLERSVEFYRSALGFVVSARESATARLAVAPGAEAILELTADASLTPPAPDAAGLFHAALLLPGRAELGAWLRHAAEAGVRFEGFADHGVSEAIYFSDPDGNGLEFYVDRPRERWPHAPDGELAMVTEPLDLPGLLAAAPGPTPHPLTGAQWGHLHLRVTNLERSDDFYRQALQLQLTQGSFPGARFLAADGYHHHLGLNHWGRPTQPANPGATGLALATFACAHASAPAIVRDPDGNGVELIPLR
jgi:catechol 2,3-dioxygenase